MSRLIFCLCPALFLILLGCNPENGGGTVAPQWEQVEIVFESEYTYANPYTDVEMHVVFRGPKGEELLRPAFWDGGKTWKVRFASPTASGVWTWRSVASDTTDTGLHGRTGRLRATEYRGDNGLIRHGLLRMSPGRRNVVHADGTPFVVVADSPWSLTHRGTPESVTVYARDRQEKGFNAALLMSVMPDQHADGPRDRTAIGGFDRGFEDLSEGHLNQPNVAYFQMLDTLTSILIDHGIVPIFAPVLQGFGWKGLGSLGSSADTTEYMRYTRFLLARYGARPAMWLISVDGRGKEPVVEPAGRLVEEWDAYGQPTGLHYNRFDDSQPAWTDDPEYGFHGNRSFHDAEWLDFQLAQTGHFNDHLPEKVYRMYDYEPVKAVANGEPTYERMGEPTNGAGWWQGHEAWLNLTSGGTMGVFYGAGGLWNWKITADEPGWEPWAETEANWEDALHFEGSRYVGYVSRALEGLDFADIERRHDLAGGRLALAKPGRLYVVYLPEGGDVTLDGLTAPLPYRWFDPQSGEWTAAGTLQPGETLHAPSAAPYVLVVGKE